MSLDIPAWTDAACMTCRWLSAECLALQGEFAMLCFGVTRDVDGARSRLENLTEIVRQSGALLPLILTLTFVYRPGHCGTWLCPADARTSASSLRLVRPIQETQG